MLCNFLRRGALLETPRYASRFLSSGPSAQHRNRRVPATAHPLASPLRRFCSTSPGTVILCDVATYVHSEINGTYQDIYAKLFELVDVVEIPNEGTVTKISFETAVMFIEDIGAHPGNLVEYLKEQAVMNRSIGFVAARVSDNAPHSSRHPRYASTSSQQDIEVDTDDEPTDELLAKSKREPVGIWFKQTAYGYMVHSRTKRMNLTFKYMEQHPVDTEFNVWFTTHMRPGWKPCGGKCAGESPPKWYSVDDEDPPSLTKELERTGCVGYCRTARKQKL